MLCTSFANIGEIIKIHFILITVSRHIGSFVQMQVGARAFHMQIDSLSLFNLPIEFNTHSTSNQKSHFRISFNRRWMWGWNLHQNLVRERESGLRKSVQVAETRAPLLYVPTCWAGKYETIETFLASLWFPFCEALNSRIRCDVTN